MKTSWPGRLCAPVLATFMLVGVPVVLLSSCSGYRDLPRPWLAEPTDDEFAARSELAEGAAMITACAPAHVLE